MTPPTKILPPVALLITILAMVALNHFLPLHRISSFPLRITGGCLMALGLGVNIWCATLFQRRGTTIIPFRESSKLITTGLFRYSRNPIYVSMVVLLLGVALALGSLGPLLAIPLFITWINWRVIAVEEAMLRERFGEEYAGYCERVRRWV